LFFSRECHLWGGVVKIYSTMTRKKKREQKTTVRVGEDSFEKDAKVA
jgi:hypothetical protein